jgi:hypothetical protein
MGSIGGGARGRRAWVLSLACAIVSAACLAAPNLIYPDRAALVHVRWGSAVDGDMRRALERRYHLTRPEAREGTTWAYYIADTSRANIRALVGDPAVEDTHNIDRSRFSLWWSAPRDPFQGPAAETLPGLLGLLSGILAASAVAAGLLAVAPRRAEASWVRIQGFTAKTARALGRIGPPPASAESAAGMRIALGLALWVIVAWQPISDDSTWIQFALLTALAAFVVGFQARVSYAIACAGLVVWAIVHSSRSNAHPYSALVLAMLAWLAAPWGEAWSIDAWRRRKTGRPAVARSGVEYGYVTWLPGVVLGVCFLAAAAAKLRESGVAWITNGTVKYHFLSDSPGAVVAWGPQLGLYPALAVAVSAAAVAIEAVVIVGALSRVYWHRAVTGALAGAILIGFGLFQGLFWPGWWVLLLSFLPWHLAGDRSRLATPAPAGQTSMLKLAQVIAVAAVVLQQLVVSAARIEVAPIFSTYDMYSSTYASPSEYETDAGLSYWLVTRSGGATRRSCAVSRAAAEAWLDEGRRDRDPEAARAATACFGERPARQLTIEGRRTRVDWRYWRLAFDERVVLGGPFWWRGPSPGSRS